MSTKIFGERSQIFLFLCRQGNVRYSIQTSILKLSSRPPSYLPAAYIGNMVEEGGGEIFVQSMLRIIWNPAPSFFIVKI